MVNEVDYTGMNFGSWCDLDIHDKRKIIYTKTPYGSFSSEDLVPIQTVKALAVCYIQNVTLKDDIWYVKLVKNKSSVKREKHE